MAPLAGEGLQARDHLAFMDDAAAAARAHDDAEHQFLAFARAEQRLGHRETIRVVLNLNFPAEQRLQVRLHRLAVHADGVGVFQQAGAREIAPGVPMPNVVGWPGTVAASSSWTI